MMGMPLVIRCILGEQVPTPTSQVRLTESLTSGMLVYKGSDYGQGTRPNTGLMEMPLTVDPIAIRSLTAMSFLLLSSTHWLRYVGPDMHEPTIQGDVNVDMTSSRTTSLG